MSGLYLVHTIPTCALAVGIFDGALNVALTDDGVGESDVVRETATPDGRGM